jgi:hypothetical protein
MIAQWRTTSTRCTFRVALAMPRFGIHPDAALSRNDHQVMSTEEHSGASDSVMESQGAATVSNASPSVPRRPLLAAANRPVEVSRELLSLDDFYRKEHRHVLGLALY